MVLLAPTWAHDEDGVGHDWISARLVPESDASAGIFPVQTITRSSRGAGLIKDWAMTTLREKLIKIGAKVVGHARYVSFQMAEVAIPRNVFANILRMIAELRPPPITSTA